MKQSTLSQKEFITEKTLLYLFIIIFSIVGGFAIAFEELLFYVIAGAVLFIAFLISNFRYPIVGLVIYLLIFMIRPQEMYPNTTFASLPIERIIGIIIILTLAFKYAYKTKRIEFFELDKGVLAFLAASFLSIFLSIWVSNSWDIFFKLMTNMMFYFVSVRLIESNKQFKLIIWLYAFSTLFIATYATVNYYGGITEHRMGIDRAFGIGGQEGTLGDPNSLASSILFGLPFIYFLIKYYKDFLIRAVLIGSMTLCLWTVILTGSRGGMLGSIFLFVMIVMHSKKKLISGFIAFLALLAFVIVMPPQYSDRFMTIFSVNSTDDATGAAESAQGRIQGLKVGFDILMHRPLTGVGMGNFAIYNSDHFGSDLQAHNLLGQLMGDLGFIGIFAFIYFLTKYFNNIKLIEEEYRRKKWVPDFNYNMLAAFRISFYMLLFLGLFSHNLYRYNWFLFASLLVIMVKLIEPKYTQDKKVKAIDIN